MALTLYAGRISLQAWATTAVATRRGTFRERAALRSSSSASGRRGDDVAPANHGLDRAAFRHPRVRPDRRPRRRQRQGVHRARRRAADAGVRRQGRQIHRGRRDRRDPRPHRAGHQGHRSQAGASSCRVSPTGISTTRAAAAASICRRRARSPTCSRRSARRWRRPSPATSSSAIPTGTRPSSGSSGCRSRPSSIASRPANPVVLVRGGHDYILNSAALRHWNISKDTPVPDGGAITRDANGELTGELVDNAKRLVVAAAARRRHGRGRAHHPAQGQRLRHHQRAHSRAATRASSSRRSTPSWRRAAPAS